MCLIFHFRGGGREQAMVVEDPKSAHGIRRFKVEWRQTGCGDHRSESTGFSAIICQNGENLGRGAHSEPDCNGKDQVAAMSGKVAGDQRSG